MTEISPHQRRAASRIALAEMWDEEVAEGLALPWRKRVTLRLAKIARNLGDRMRGKIPGGCNCHAICIPSPGMKCRAKIGHLGLPRISWPKEIA